MSDVINAAACGSAQELAVLLISLIINFFSAVFVFRLAKDAISRSSASATAARERW